ncbi:hypothetical protein AMATHDRAFT_50616 [Amanita thiersii Skay4041]|uniref:DUF6534 domain-containing protein n=1 Tax=Amanita thiersii Skay4041 TaxID=703135 RepID=A0A2A9NH21_9AGAR|nr:hypothetical protein AMATHDRAFT_50616 [Amanita thiersii Skay4041]
MDDFSKASFLTGIILSWNLYGILTVQTYLYYLAFPKDRKWTKCVVYAIYVLETVHTVIVTIGYNTFVDIPLAHPPVPIGQIVSNSLMFIFIPVTGGLAISESIDGNPVSLITTSVYAYRIRVVTQSRIVAWVLLVLSCVQFIAAVIFVAGPISGSAIREYISWLTGDGSLVLKRRNPIMAYIWLGVSVVCDVTVATIMVYALSKERILSKEMRWRISKLLRLTMETGAVTATSSWTKALYLVPMIILSKVYANALMVLLNNRMSIVGSRRRPPADLMITQLSELRFQPTHEERVGLHVNFETQRGRKSGEELCSTDAPSSV